MTGGNGNMFSQPGIRALLHDPALVALGLVPARSASSDGLSGDVGAALSWRAAWSAIGIGFVVLIGLFWQTAAQMVGTWYDSSTFNHGFLILPICGYLVWIKRAALAERAPQPTLWCAALALPAALGWLLGHVASVAVVQQFALVIVVQALFLTVLGPRIARVLACPLFYLFFAVPFGEFLIPPLQDLTATFVVAFMRMIDIPIFLDGIFISIPTGNFVVAEACAGVRFLIATLALGFLFAELTYVSLWRRAAFVALSFVVPVVANGFRAFGIVLIAYLSNNELAVGVDHLVYGWIFFAIVTVILLSIGMTFRDAQPGDPAPDPEAMRGAAAAQVMPRRVVAAASACVLVAALAPAYGAYVDRDRVTALAVPLSAPAPAGGWAMHAGAASGWSPSFPGADARLLQGYAKDGRTVQLFIAYYRSERQGRELISAHNSFTGEEWSRAAGRTVEIALEGGRVLVDSTRMLRQRKGRLALHWFWVGGTYTANPYLAKILQARDRLLGGAGTSAAIAVSTTYEELPDEAEARLRDFLSAMAPVQPLLRRLAAE